MRLRTWPVLACVVLLLGACTAAPLAATPTAAVATTAAPLEATQPTVAGEPSPTAEGTVEALSGREVVIAEGGAAAFYTPSGNIHCLMAGSFVRCDISEHTWPMPPRSADCELDWVPSATLDEIGADIGLCEGQSIAPDVVLGTPATQWHDTELDLTFQAQGFGESAALNYGSTLTDGVLVCSVDEDGVRCTHPAGPSFHLARDLAQVTYAKP